MVPSIAMNKITIEIANQSHAHKLADLMQQLGYIMTVAAMETRVAVYSTQHFHHAWVALIDKQIVGGIALVMVDNFHEENRIATVISLVIDKDYRQQGIGKKLLRYAEDYAQAQGCHCIELITHVKRAAMGVHKFYDDLGYQTLNDQFKFMRKMLGGKTTIDPAL